MSALSKREYEKKVALICNNTKTELPVAYYDHDGDCIEVLMKGEPYYGERIDDLVTVYCSEANEEIVGCLVKGVKRVFENDPKTKVILQAGRVRLSDFFLVGFLTQNTTDIRTYQKLRECVENLEIETELCCS